MTTFDAAAYMASRHDWMPITESDIVPDTESDDHHTRVKELLPALDWHALWADEEEEEWIIEPILPARRLVALYSAPKVGKSLLMLEMAVAVSRGTEVLGSTPDRARRVLYVDFENDPKADIRERLQAMGYGPDDLVDLCYLSYPTLRGLDSEAGSLELMAAVETYGCEVVMVDTVSRSVDGDENENDTWLHFYRHTGLKLKQAQVALIRLDHSGKDETKGQRGGSAKVGDVDAVWRLSRVGESDDTFSLTCEANRMQVHERELVITREVEPTLRHKVQPNPVRAALEAKEAALVRVLDQLDINPEWGRRKVREELKKAGRKGANDTTLGRAIATRRSVFRPVDNPVDNTPNQDRDVVLDAPAPPLDAEWCSDSQHQSAPVTP